MVGIYAIRRTYLEIFCLFFYTLLFIKVIKCVPTNSTRDCIANWLKLFQARKIISSFFPFRSSFLLFFAASFACLLVCFCRSVVCTTFFFYEKKIAYEFTPSMINLQHFLIPSNSTQSHHISRKPD